MVSWDNIKKNEHLVLVVPRKKLFGEQEKSFFQGFSKQDFLPRLVGNTGFLTRGRVNTREEHVNDGLFAEADENYKQIIPYVILINTNLKKVYAYQRGSTFGQVHDGRLHGNWAWGVGGHVDFHEDFFSMTLTEFLKENLYRELEEETTISHDDIKDLKLIGYINDETDSIGRVHIGVVYVAEVETKDIAPKDNESVQGKFLSLDELEEIAFTPNVNCDNWSRIVMEPLRELLS